MADFYPSSSGNNIGTLLRLIQEDQSKNQANTPPAAEPGSPIRGAVQQPLQSPESPQSSRVVSIKPEGAIQQGPQQSVGSGVIPPSATAPSSGGVIAARAPIAPAPSAPGGEGGGSSFSAQSSPSSAPSARVSSAPTIGTTIKSLPISNSKASVLGSSTVKKATPKSAPATPKSAPKPSSVGNYIVRNLNDLINQSFKSLPSTGIGGRQSVQKILRGFA